MTRILIAGDFSPTGRLSTLGSLRPSEVFGTFHATITGSDLAVVNLECPLCEPVQPIAKTGPSLHGPPGAARFLADAGFGLVTMANNHIMDYGPAGLAETFQTLEAAGVNQVGAGMDHVAATKPYLWQAGDRAIAILNLAENEWSTTHSDVPGASPIDPIRNYAVIREYRAMADHVIVICHGGHEMHPLPSPRMTELFRFYVDAGASAVVNHHTHCTSGFEVYNGTPIFYSLGNFLFDKPNRRSGPWARGIALELILQEEGVTFEIHHFDQCTDDTLFALPDKNEIDSRNQALAELNRIIADPGALNDAFIQLVQGRTRQYQAYLEPTLNRWISAAQNRGLLPSLLTKKQRRLLLNLIRCESHREIVMELLERDAGHTR